MENAPWAGAVTEGSLSVVVQNCGNVAQTRAGLNGGNLGRRVDCYLAHTVELDDEMAILSAEAKRGVAVAARLGIDLDTVLGTTCYRSSYLLGVLHHRDCDWCVLDPLVESPDVIVPVGRSLGIHRNVGRLEAVVNGSALSKGVRDGQGRGRDRQGELEPHDGCVVVPSILNRDNQDRGRAGRRLWLELIYHGAGS